MREALIPFEALVVVVGCSGLSPALERAAMSLRELQG